MSGAGIRTHTLQNTLFEKDWDIEITSFENISFTKDGGVKIYFKWDEQGYEKYRYGLKPPPSELKVFKPTNLHRLRNWIILPVLAYLCNN